MQPQGIPDNYGFYLMKIYIIFISISPIHISREYTGIKKRKKYWKSIIAVIKML